MGSGFLSSVKERLKASQSYGRVSEKADIGIDIAKPSRPRSDKDDLFESKDERRARHKAKTDRIYGKINSGFSKYEKGVKTVQKFGDMFNGGSGGRRKGRRSDDLDFGFGGSSGGSRRNNSDDLGFSSFGSMAGFGGSERKPKTSRRKEVPIYKGNRIVGYRQTGGKKKRSQPKSIFDI